MNSGEAVNFQRGPRAELYVDGFAGNEFGVVHLYLGQRTNQS
jgi:hypothetical protein